MAPFHHHFEQKGWAEPKNSCKILDYKFYSHPYWFSYIKVTIKVKIYGKVVCHLQ